MDAAHRITTPPHIDLLPRSTHRALDQLSRQAWLKNSPWYLAGGTGLALMAGHRVSVDLDFFYPQKEFATQKLLSHFSKTGWTSEIVREGSVYGTLLGAKISFIAYPFFVPQKPFFWYGGVRILNPDNIAVMKIIAISQRGRMRDFIDLYWYCLHQKPLQKVIEQLPIQYPTVAHNYNHIIKSLTYFSDAENDPMPTLFFKATWKQIKMYFRREVPRVAREALRLT